MRGVIMVHYFNMIPIIYDHLIFKRLLQMCHDKAASVDFLQQAGMLHQQRQCPNGHPMTLSLGQTDRWRCRLRGCRSELGLPTGTFLQGSRISFEDVIHFIYCWANELTILLPL